MWFGDRKTGRGERVGAKALVSVSTPSEFQEDRNRHLNRYLVEARRLEALKTVYGVLVGGKSEKMEQAICQSMPFLSQLNSIRDLSEEPCSPVILGCRAFFALIFERMENDALARLKSSDFRTGNSGR